MYDPTLEKIARRNQVRFETYKENTPIHEAMMDIQYLLGYILKEIIKKNNPEQHKQIFGEGKNE